MKQTKIHMEGMSCHHCEQRVNNAIKALKGVRDCKADAKSGDVLITSDDDFDIMANKEYVDEIGYEWSSP